ncbi:MAG: c-type cytochrome [Woeseiaceae bacterium]
MDSHTGTCAIRNSALLSMLGAVALLASAGGCQNVRGEPSSEVDASVPVGDAATPVPYTVECGQVDDDGEPFCYVDRDTYIGWRTFHGFCHVCHAQDAVGSTFAPPLIDRMQTFDLFVERTANGYTGQVGVMPPWKDNPNVSKRYAELYSYLRARADGVLPPGRPKRMP